jgi:hypothetical protein
VVIGERQVPNGAVRGVVMGRTLHLCASVSLEASLPGRDILQAYLIFIRSLLGYILY